MSLSHALFFILSLLWLSAGVCAAAGLPAAAPPGSAAAAAASSESAETRSAVHPA